MSMMVLGALALTAGACVGMVLDTEAPAVAPLRPLDAHAVVLEDSILEATVEISFASVVARLDEVTPAKLDRMGDRGVEPESDLSKRWGQQWTDTVNGVRLRSGLERKSLRAEFEGATLVVEAEYDLAVLAAIPRPGDRPALFRSCGCQGELWCNGRTDADPPRVLVRVATALSVGDSWALVPKTSIDIVVARSCELGRDANGQAIEVMPTVLAPFRAHVEEHAGVVDRAVEQIDGLHDKTNRVWQALMQPSGFGSDPRHLLLRPAAIGLGELTGEGTSLHAPVRFAMRPVVTLDEPAEPTPLPAPREVNDASGLRLAAGIEIDLATASDTLREQLVGNRFPRRPARYLRISDATIYGSPTRAVVRLEIDGSARGALYVQGRLRLDQEAGMIVLEDLEVERSSREVIAGFYDVLEHPDARIERVPWFTPDEVKDLVQAAARWPIAGAVESLREQITAAFRLPVSGRLRLSATIDEIVLMNLWIDQAAIRLAVVAVGDLGLLPREQPDAPPSPDAPARLHPKLPTAPTLEPEPEPEPAKASEPARATEPVKAPTERVGQ